MLNLSSIGDAWLLQVCLDSVLLDQLATSGMCYLFSLVYLPAFQYCILIESFLDMGGVFLDMHLIFERGVSGLGDPSVCNCLCS